MKILNTVTGRFDNEANAEECLRNLCMLSVPTQNIRVRGINSKHLRAVTARLLARNPIGNTICKYAVSGAILGGVTVLCVIRVSPPWELLRELGLPWSFLIGGIFGCMIGTLVGAIVGAFLFRSSCNVTEGRPTEHKVVITVPLPEDSSDKQAVKRIMQDCGAVGVTDD